MSNIAHVYVDGKPVSALNPLPTSGAGGGGGAGDVNLVSVGGAAISQSAGVQNVSAAIVNPTTNGVADSVGTPNNALLAPMYAWNGVNQAFDRIRSAVSTFSAANSDFTTTVTRTQDRIVFGLTCQGNERIVKVYRVGVQTNMDNDSVMNPLSLRLYKGIDTGNGDPINLDRVNHDNSFGGPFGNNLSPTARPIVYRSGAGGGAFIDGSVRAANTYVRRRFQSQMWDFGTPPRQPLILRGDRNGIVLVNNADFGDDYVLSVWVEWTEEVEGQAVP